MTKTDLSERTPTALSLLGSLTLSLGLTLEDASDLVLRDVHPGHGWLTNKWPIAPQVISHLQPACNLLAFTGAEAAQGHLDGLCSALAGARGVLWLLAGGTEQTTEEVISTVRAECVQDTDDRDDRAWRIAEVAALLPGDCQSAVLDATSLDTALARLVGLTTSDVEAALPGLDKRRARRVLSGAVEWPEELDTVLERRVLSAALDLSPIAMIDADTGRHDEVYAIRSLPPHLASAAWQIWPRARDLVARYSPWFQSGEPA